MRLHGHAELPGLGVAGDDRVRPAGASREATISRMTWTVPARAGARPRPRDPARLRAHLRRRLARRAALRRRRALACDDPDVPWHRVVRADGSLAKGERQRALLEAEGVPFRGERVDMRS